MSYSIWGVADLPCGMKIWVAVALSMLPSDVIAGWIRSLAVMCVAAVLTVVVCGCIIEPDGRAE